MPRRKITLEEAFATIEAHNLRVRVEAVDTPVPSTAPASDFIEQPQPTPTLPQKIGSTVVKLTLHAQHSVSSGGHMVGDGNQKHVEYDKGGGVVTYGPGVCYVPVRYADQIAHADQLAKQADERFLERNQRTYLVVPRISSAGHHNVAIQLETFPERLTWENVYKV